MNRCLLVLKFIADVVISTAIVLRVFYELTFDPNPKEAAHDLEDTKRRNEELEARSTRLEIQVQELKINMLDKDSEIQKLKADLKKKTVDVDGGALKESQKAEKDLQDYKGKYLDLLVEHEIQRVQIERLTATVQKLSRNSSAQSNHQTATPLLDENHHCMPKTQDNEEQEQEKGKRKAQTDSDPAAARIGKKKIRTRSAEKKRARRNDGSKRNRASLLQNSSEEERRKGHSSGHEQLVS
jgi:hypothetical protein